MRVIWKYHLELNPGDLDAESSFTIEMPEGAEVLCVQAQFDTELMLWARVNNETTTMEKRRFWIFDSGHTISNNVPLTGRYIGTAQLHGGRLVLHVFGNKI